MNTKDEINRPAHNHVRDRLCKTADGETRDEWASAVIPVLLQADLGRLFSVWPGDMRLERVAGEALGC